MFASIVLFLVGSSWWLELGGLDNNQLHYLNATITNNSKVETSSTEFLQSHSLRLKVDIPDSQQAPPLAAVTPLLNILSSMGFSVLSHNDEYRQSKDMVYLTWILQKERDIE